VKVVRSLLTFRRLFFCVLLGAALLGLTAATASAQSSPQPTLPPGNIQLSPTPQPGPNLGNPGPQSCQSQTSSDTGGLQGMLGAPCIRGSNAPTLYEKYPSTAYQLHSSTGDWAMSLRNVLAGWMLDWLTGLGALCSTLLSWVFDLQLTNNGLGTQVSNNPVNGTLNGMLDGVVKALNEGVYRPFSISAVLIAGLYVLWFGVLKRKMSVTVESAGWVLLAMSVAAFFFAAPSAAVGSLQGVSQLASQAILGAVSKADPNLNDPQNTAVYKQDPTTEKFSGLRAAINSYWTVYVYRPWEAAEFGDIGVAQTKENGQSMTWAERDLQANAQGDQAKQQFESAYHTYLDGQPNGAQLKSWYDANSANVRVSEMGLALLAALLCDILLLIIAGSVIMAQLGVILLTMVAPLFFLVGIHPGVGRRIFIRWAELMLGFLARSVLYAAFLAVLLVFGGMIASGVGQRSWLLASALEIGLVVAALRFRKPIAQVFGQVGSVRLEHLMEPQRLRTAIFGEQVPRQAPVGVATDSYARAPRRRQGLMGVFTGAAAEAAGVEVGAAAGVAGAAAIFDRDHDRDVNPVNMNSPKPQPKPQQPAPGQIRPQPGGGRVIRDPEQQPKPVGPGAGAVTGAAIAASGGSAIAAGAGAAAVEAATEKVDSARRRIGGTPDKPIELFLPGEVPNRGGAPIKNVTPVNDDLSERRAQSRKALMEEGDE
jgi:TrbL/VirB6 plasmid conjugal transfer protein